MKTFGEKEGFAKHCYADAMKCILWSHHIPAYVLLGGAMRLPGKVEVINFNIGNVASYIAFSPVKLFKKSV